MPDPEETAEVEAEETQEVVEPEEADNPYAELSDREKEYIDLARGEGKDWSASQMVDQVSAGRMATTQLHEQKGREEKRMWTEREKEKEKEVEPEGDPEDMVTRAQAKKIAEQRVNEVVDKRFEQLDHDGQHESCLAALGLDNPILQEAARKFAQGMIDEGKCTLEQAYVLYGDSLKSHQSAGTAGVTTAKIKRTAAMNIASPGGSVGGTTAPATTAPPADSGEDCFAPEYMEKTKREYANSTLP